jgi:predicted Abi (CAAX) family protease
MFGHLDKISQQSHQSAPTHAPSLRSANHPCPVYFVKVHHGAPVAGASGGMEKMLKLLSSRAQYAVRERHRRAPLSP